MKSTLWKALTDIIKNKSRKNSSKKPLCPALFLIENNSNLAKTVLKKFELNANRINRVRINRTQPV